VSKPDTKNQSDIAAPPSCDAHEYAELFPRMSDTEFQALVFSIRENGLEEPIVKYKGEILDGRNRYSACIDAQVELKFVEYDGDDPFGYVIRKNLHRRHLSESQRAMLGADLANLEQGARTDLSPIGEWSVSQSQAAEMFGVGKRSIERAKKVKENGIPALVEKVKAGDLPVSVAAQVAKETANEQKAILKSADPKTEIKKRKRQAKLKSVENSAAAMPKRKYAVIYADPPWPWDTYSEAGKDRSPENHYPLMDIDTISELGVPAADDAVLFLWATAPQLERALEIITYWGFAYKSNIVWKKDKRGTGYWCRNCHEHLLVATRGNIPAPEMGQQCDSVIEAKVGKHSAKPEDFRGIIDGYYPDVTKLEIFARGTAPDGWVTWGNEATELTAMEKAASSPPEEPNDVKDLCHIPPKFDRRDKPEGTLQ
jgi:N6-adenosine-specific RNA methylase IME4